MAQITKEMIIGDVIKLDQGLIPILLDIGMHCLGCPSAQGESLEDAAMVHGINPDDLVNKLNAQLESK